MRTFLYIKSALLALGALILTACSSEDSGDADAGDVVAVSFRPTVDDALQTRTGGNVVANRLVCAVFMDGKELTEMRKVINLDKEATPTFTPWLVKGNTYDIVFWASKDGCYDVTDLTAIVRNAPAYATGTERSEADFDAFAGSVAITVADPISKEVLLHRPLAQLNMGTTLESWDAATNGQSDNDVPATIKIMMKGKTAFNALAGEAAGNEESLEYSMPIMGTDIEYEGVAYKQLTSCFVLPDAQQPTVNVSYCVYDKSGKPITDNVTVGMVPIKANYRTNVMGTLLIADAQRNVRKTI